MAAKCPRMRSAVTFSVRNWLSAGSYAITEIWDVSPLSPVRVWASSRSCISGHLVADVGARLFLREQRRNDGHDLARGLRRTSASRRAVGVQRLDLVADAHGLFHA